jgi:dCMP deaminase
MGRISRQVMFMDMARAASKRSTCFRRNVGALVVHKNNPVSAGWNGQEPGATHCTGNDCPGIVPGMCGTLHAEHNAMRVACSLLLPGDTVDLYSTDAPCPECCLLLRNSALYVKRIFFEVPYRDMTALTSLQHYADPERHDVAFRRTEVYEVTPAGYIVEHFTRKVLELP